MNGDFKDVLRRAIAKNPHATPEFRQSVYRRAREALLRYGRETGDLEAGKLDRQLRDLDETIDDIERLYAPDGGGPGQGESPGQGEDPGDGARDAADPVPSAADGPAIETPKPVAGAAPDPEEDDPAEPEDRDDGEDEDEDGDGEDGDEDSDPGAFGAADDGAGGSDRPRRIRRRRRLLSDPNYRGVLVLLALLFVAIVLGKSGFGGLNVAAWLPGRPEFAAGTTRPPVADPLTDLRAAATTDSATLVLTSSTDAVEAQARVAAAWTEGAAGQAVARTLTINGNGDGNGNGNGGLGVAATVEALADDGASAAPGFLTLMFTFTSGYQAAAATATVNRVLADGRARRIDSATSHIGLVRVLVGFSQPRPCPETTPIYDFAFPAANGRTLHAIIPVKCK